MVVGLQVGIMNLSCKKLHIRSVRTSNVSNKASGTLTFSWAFKAISQYFVYQWLNQ